MTPDEVDVLLNRLAPPAPAPLLRDRVLAELGRRMKADPRILPIQRQKSARKSVWGGVALALALGGFAGILWLVLPKLPGFPLDSAPGTDVGRRDEDFAFARREWESASRRPGISRLTLSDRLYVEATDGTLTALDRGTGRSAWIFQSDVLTPVDWAPVTAQGVPEELRALEGDLLELSRRIGEKTAEPGAEAALQDLQKRRSQIRERLRVVAFGDNLYWTSGQMLTCLDRSSGVLKWTQRLPFAPSGPPAAIRNYLFVPDAAGSRVVALDVEKQGAEAATYPVKASAGPNRALGGPVYSEPFVYFVGSDGAAYCFKVTDGTLTWIYETRSAPVGEPLVHILRVRRVAIRLLLFSTGHTLYAMDADAGTLVWKYDCGAPLVGKPVVESDIVYVGTEKGNLLALSALPGQNLKPGAGELRWQVAGANRFLMKGPKNLYVLGTNQEILAVKEATGVVSGRFPLGRFSQLQTNVSDGFLYVVRPGGNVVCLTEAD